MVKSFKLQNKSTIKVEKTEEKKWVESPYVKTTKKPFRKVYFGFYEDLEPPKNVPNIKNPIKA